MSTFADMNKADLVELVVKYNLEDKLNALGSDPKKIRNELIINILEEYKASKEAGSDVGEEAKAATETKSKPVSKGKKMTVEDTREYLMTALPYIITDHDDTIQVKDDAANRVIEFSWGNPVIGMKHEKVALHGMRQYVTRGGIKAMKKMMIPRTEVDPNTKQLKRLGSRPRFSIAPTEGLTDAEWKKLETENVSKMKQAGAIY